GDGRRIIGPDLRLTLCLRVSVADLVRERLEDRARHRRSFSAMRAREKDDHRQLDVRWLKFRYCIHWTSKTDKPTIGAKTFGRLSCAGLTNNRERQRIQPRAARSAVADRAVHSFDDDAALLSGNLY